MRASLLEEERGHLGPSVVECDLDYFIAFAAADRYAYGEVHDGRALPVRYPVDLENRYLPTWPPFLLDLMPQGHARRKLAEHMRLGVDDRASDVPLLMRAAGHPIGNIRVREQEHGRRYPRQDRTVYRSRGSVRNDRVGFERTSREWPKVALTMANDGLYYADAFVQDEEAVRHVIVKLLRSREERDRLILEAEAGYSVIARELGLKVHEPSTYTEGVLMIPGSTARSRMERRFDRESMVSAIGVAAYGHLANHEDYIDVLRKYSSDPYGDIAEYVKRDIANQAFGNPDNHGRNTAISKGPLGGVSIARYTTSLRCGSLWRDLEIDTLGSHAGHAPRHGARLGRGVPSRISRKP